MPRVSWKLNLAMLWFSQLVIMAGYQALTPFISLFIKNDMGVTSPGELAVAVASYNFATTAGYAIFNPVWGTLADRFGVKPMLLRGTFLTGIFFPMMAYTKSIWLLILLRFISAACAGTTAASQTMVARNTPDEHQGFAQGVLTTAIWGGAMLGNVIGGLLIHYFNYKVAFWVCGSFYALGGISILFTRDTNLVKVKAPASHIKQHGMTALLPKFSTAVWIMLSLFLLMGIVRNLEAPYIALRVEEMTDKETAALWTGIISAAVCAAAIISGVVSGALVDRYPVGKILIPVILFSSLALAMQGFADNLWVFGFGRVLLYTAAGGLQPILQKNLSSVTPQRKRGKVFGFASSASAVGGMLSAVFGGLAMTACGISGVFYISAIAFAATLPVMLRGISRALQPFRFHRAR
ncbi:MAG: multidrug efflux MFS transporter [Lentisphaerae bacterium]|nr:multidrug efflux MFS transporter [Lentisphaerota bacterium]